MDSITSINNNTYIHYIDHKYINYYLLEIYQLMKFSKKFISLFYISLASSCTYKYDGDNAIINDILESQNYQGEISDLIGYALLTIFLFFIIGYLGNKNKKKKK